MYGLIINAGGLSPSMHYVKGTVATTVDPMTKFHFTPGDAESQRTATQLAEAHADGIKARIASRLGRQPTDLELSRGRLHHSDPRTEAQKSFDANFETVKRDSRQSKYDRAIDELSTTAANDPVTKAMSISDPAKRQLATAKALRDRDMAREDDAAALAVARSAHLEQVGGTLKALATLRERLSWDESATAGDLIRVEHCIAQISDPLGCPVAGEKMLAELKASEQQRHAVATAAAQERLAAAQAEAARIAEAA